MKPIFVYSAFIVLLLFLSCKPSNHASFPKISHSVILRDIPSGSGIAVSGDSAWIVGDDAPFIYYINIKDDKFRKFSVPGYHGLARIPRTIKPDYEAATFAIWDNKKYLLAFGSGTKKITRDSLLLVNINNTNEIQVASLTLLYQYLREKLKISFHQWNIEGATCYGNILYLLNRGNNALISFTTKSFFEFVLNNHNNLEELNSVTLKLPSIRGIEARLSGGTMLNDDQMMFSASVEDTPDWVSDGPVLGSIIGVYSISQKKLLYSNVLKGKKESPLREKIESIDVISITKREITALAVSDNDDGSSILFTLSLNHVIE